MKEKLKELRMDFLISSILCIILGIILILWGDVTLIVIGRVLGVMLILMGVACLGNFFLSELSGGLTAFAGAVLALVGIWIVVRPTAVASIVPIMIGVVMIFHGIRGIRVSWEAKGYGYSNWFIGVLLAVISILLGVLCIVDAFGIMTLAMMVIGISLIYNGVSDIWMVTRVRRAEKLFRDGAIDVDIVD